MNTVLILLAVLVIFAYFFRKDIKEKIRPDREKNLSIDDQFNAQRRARELEIDKILSKMGKNGVSDLSKEDKQRLDELSKK